MVDLKISFATAQRVEFDDQNKMDFIASHEGGKSNGHACLSNSHCIDPQHSSNFWSCQEGQHAAYQAFLKGGISRSGQDRVSHFMSGD